MAAEVIMPQMGFDMKEGTVVRWIKREGDEVARGEPVVEIETDKAVVEVEAAAAGVLRKLVVGEGVTVPVGQIIAVIAAADEELPESALPPVQVAETDPLAHTVPQPRAEVETGQRGGAPELDAPAPPPARQDQRLRASPLARREAEERGIDLALVVGTGPNGRITRSDVAKLASGAPPAPAPQRTSAQAPAGQVVPLSRMRQAIAANMTRSKQEVPHFYVSVEVDMTEAVKLRGQANEALEGDARVSINDMVIKACAMALPKHPVFNASYTGQGLHLHGEINIGIAVALEEGLIAPAIVDAGSKSLVEIAQASRRVAERARAGKLSADEYTGATFNVTNLGMYNVESFSAIITPPQSAALAVGSVRQVPVFVDNGEVRAAGLMKLTLSIDHRAADGAQAASFLADIKNSLERPMTLLL